MANVLGFRPAPCSQKTVVQNSYHPPTVQPLTTAPSHITRRRSTTVFQLSLHNRSILASSTPQNTPSTSSTTLSPQQLMPSAGIYIRDFARSDMEAYEQALKLLQLDKLQRITALQLIEGIELQWNADNTALDLRFLTVVPFFKVTERYNVNARNAITRRDLRPGKREVTATIDPINSTLVLSSIWADPNAGRLTESLMMIDDITLEYVTDLEVAAGKQTVRLYYRKEASWQPKNSWNPLEAMKILKHR